MEHQLLEATSKLYSVFKPYVVHGDLRGRSCDCCVTDEEIRLLLSKPLKELTEGDLRHFMSSAISTFGNVEDYKHFLPRILELMQEAETGVLEDFLDFEKLNYGEWEIWGEKEINAIDDYFFELWETKINDEASTFCQIDSILKIIYKYSGLEKALVIWENSNSEKGMLYMVDLVLSGFYYSDKDEFVNTLMIWFSSKDIVSKIENQFFKTEDEDLAWRIAIAHNLLEK